MPLTGICGNGTWCNGLASERGNHEVRLDDDVPVYRGFVGKIVLAWEINKAQL